MDRLAAVNWTAYQEEALAAIGSALSETELDDARVKYLGRKSELAQALRGVRGKEKFELTPRELSVLALLHRERGNAVSRDRILNEVWGIEYYGTTRTLDQLIVKLRQKIEDEPGEPRHVLTVHGLGYRLDA